jgi:hypothetical protein
MLDNKVRIFGPRRDGEKERTVWDRYREWWVRTRRQGRKDQNYITGRRRAEQDRLTGEGGMGQAAGGQERI